MELHQDIETISHRNRVCAQLTAVKEAAQARDQWL